MVVVDGSWSSMQQLASRLDFPLPVLSADFILFFLDSDLAFCPVPSAFSF
jgi:hypothetical protein